MILSDIICSATVTRAAATGEVVSRNGNELEQWTAQALVDRVFVGVLAPQFIEFEYYNIRQPTPDYTHPPTAHFQVGVRCVLFLRGRQQDLKLADPLYKMEIEIATHPPSAIGPTLGANVALAKELVYAIESAPDTIGRSATHYFSWVEELVGKQSIPLVRPFLESSDPLVRYEAAWWLSFKELTPAVMKHLRKAMDDKTLESWASSGARDRLRDIHAGNWVPKD